MINKQQIRPTLVNRAFQKLAKINTFYNITIDNEREDSNEQSDLVLWKLLTNKNVTESNNSDQTDSDDDTRHDKFTERELKESSSPFPIVMLMDQKYLPLKFLIQHPQKVKFLFLLIRNLIGKHLLFLKTIRKEEANLMGEEIPITRSKYVHARLELDDRFAANR